MMRLILLAALLVANPTWGDGGDFESSPVLTAQEFAGSVPLATEYYDISGQVPTDGFMARVTIFSPFGEFVASGPGMLATRVDEVQALAALEEMEDDERFKEAAADTALHTAGNLRALVEDPSETLKGVPEGVGRFFSRTGRSLKTGVQKLGDVRRGETPGVDAQTNSALPGAPGAPAVGGKESFAETVARASGDVFVDVLGFDKQRRRLAQDLGVDPYTTNPVLSQKLDEVTWAAFAGGLGVNVMTSLIPGGFILSTSSTLSDWVWETAPGDLRLVVESQLQSIAVEEAQIDRFLRHELYPLSMQAVFASSMASLDGVKGRAKVIPLALSAGSEGQAMFVVQTLDMMARYHREEAPLAELRVQGTVIAIEESGKAVVMAPVDYLSWNETLAGFVAGFSPSADLSPTMHISGGASARAISELENAGWTVETESAFGPRGYPVR